jgi:diguanylate cyclase
VQYEHDKDQAQEYSSLTLERIKREKLPATPDIYKLWYVYYSGQSPEVTRAIDILVSNKQAITQERCHELYNKFLSEERNQEKINKAGENVQTTIQSVSAAVKGVKSATSEYSGKLGDISAEIEHVEDADSLKGIMTRMVSDTKDMLDHNQKLEEQLDESSVVLEELKRDLENVRKEALTDGLTGLSNRKAFDNELERIAAEADQAEAVFSLLMVDIDHFKSFNDNFGHQIGDQVLRLVARTLTDGVKGRDVAARYGGEEFAIVLPETPLKAAVTVGNALRRAVASKDVVNRNSGEKLGSITMSVGAAEYAGNEDVAELISRADAALYTAKHNGRNQVAAAPTPGKKQVKEAS